MNSKNWGVNNTLTVVEPHLPRDLVLPADADIPQRFDHAEHRLRPQVNGSGDVLLLLPN